ncbi:MAG: hypothetical protein WD944_01430 [Steroidobacteraceae bacterium]
MRKLPETFPKDRRFLLAVSVAVIAFYVLHASVKPQVEHDGFLFNIGRPGYLIWGLWAIWIYAALRYWHTFFAYFDDIRGRILAEVSRRQTTITRKAAVREAKRQARIGNFGVGFGDAIPFPDTLMQVLEGSPHEMLKDEIERIRESGTIFFTRHLDGTCRFEKLTIKFAWPQVGNEFRSEQVDFEMRWSARRRKWVRFRSWFSAIWNMPSLNVSRRHTTASTRGRSDFRGSCLVYVQARSQGPLYSVTQFLVLDCEDREGRTARTTFRANRDIVARGKYLRDSRSSNFGRTLAGYV